MRRSTGRPIISFTISRRRAGERPHNPYGRASELGAKRLNQRVAVAKLSVGWHWNALPFRRRGPIVCMPGTGRNQYSNGFDVGDKIAVIIDEKEAERAARLIHAEFGLGRLLPAASATQPLA